MGISIGSNFDVQSAIPLDKRTIVADITARNALAAGVRYLGMEVFVQSDEVKYRLVGGITNADWVAESSSSITADATTTVKGKILLAGDLSGTADLPTVPALAGKEPTITAGTTSQYYRGDKTFQTLDKSAVGLANVNNTNDADKAISTLTQAALDLKAPLASPALTGNPTVPNQSPLDSSTKIANTKYVDDAVAAVGAVTVSLVEPTISFGINYVQTLTSYTTTKDTYIQGPITIGTSDTVTIGANKTLNIT